MTNPAYPAKSGLPLILTGQVPYSQEAEEAVIGAVLVNPEAFLGVASFLQADDFYILRHTYIWEALHRLSDRNENIDYLTVQEELRAANRLNEIGGPAYLTQLMNSMPTSMHAEIYGRIVERAAIRRRLMVTADEIKSLALDEELAIEKVTDEAESKLFRVTERNLRRDMMPMREAISDYFDRIEHLMQHQDEPLGLPSGFRDLDQLLGGLQRSDLLIFAGRPGMGKCVAEGTLIPTEHGLVPIESLMPSDATGIPDDEGGIFYPLEVGVQTPAGVRTTSHFYDSGIKPTLRVKTRAGYSLTGTHVHPIMILSPSGEKVWKPLAEIETGDFVAVQRHEAVWGEQLDLPAFSFEYYRSGLTYTPNFPTAMTVDLAYMLGLLVGDGNLTRKNYVSFSTNDADLLSAFYDWAESMGLKARHRAAYDHTIGSVVLNAWLKNLGVSGHAHEKEVPHTILTASRECVLAFLQGLFDTDGHAESQCGHIQYVTASRKMAEQVHLLLLQFGIVSKLTFKPNKFRGAWSIRITGAAARNFYEHVGFRLERKQARSTLQSERANSNLDVIPHLPPRQSSFTKQLNFTRYFRGEKQPSYPTLRQIAAYAPEVAHLVEPEFYWDEITSIEDGGLQHCYDLTVPGEHAFVANGIVSHNTSFLLSIALNTAKVGARVAIFTMEMGYEQITQRFMSMETGINTQRLRAGQIDQKEWARFVQASGRMGNLGIFIDDSPALTPLQMRTKCRRLAHEFGLDLVIVDYMQLMSAGGQYENNRVQEISYISRAMKELARELNVPVVSAAQLSRAVEQRQDKRPQLSDLRESGCLAGDTLVYLPATGQHVPIRSLNGANGFNVLSVDTDNYKLDSAAVQHAFCTGVKPVYRLTTRLGRTIRATGNHKFLTLGGWKRLDELTPDDEIAVPRVLKGPEAQTMRDDELALLGHLIGDGCTLPKHAIQYTTREPELAEMVVSLADNVFGEMLRPRIHLETGRAWYQVFLTASQRLTHGVYNPVKLWLEELGCFGLRSYEKFVPGAVFAQPASAIGVFLRHLWATDGSVNMKKTTKGVYPAVYYATSSNRLAHDVQALLLRLNINARIKRVPQVGKGCDQYHVIVTGATDLALFVERVGAVGTPRRERLALIANYLATHVENTNRDIIPREVWQLHAIPAMQAQGVTTRALHAGLGNAYCGTALYKQNISRVRATRLAEAVVSEPIRALATSDVYWDAIVSIEPDGETDVYDLTVPGPSNFVANNIIVHNSIEQDADLVMFLYRDIVYNEATEFPNRADIIIAKHRNGPTGVVSLHFEKSLTKFSDARTQSIDLSGL